MATKLWLDYAIRAMNPVNKEVTHKIMEQTSLIENIVKPIVAQQGIKADFLMVGSVAAQTHIEPNCCVDLLVQINTDEEKSRVGDNWIIEQLVQLKCLVQNQISSKFPETKFSESQQFSLKSINLDKPFNINLFFGTKHTNLDKAPGMNTSPEKISVLNFRNMELVDMNPFQNTLQLNRKDILVNQNVKPLIRILKTIKNNARNPISLTGHEITSIVYSMENYLLEKPNGQLLFLLLECSLFLKYLEGNQFLRNNLKSPDNIQFKNKENELRIQQGIHFLKIELDLLIRNLVLEIDLYTNVYEHAAKV
jgi:hypothetical protein